MRAAVLQVLLKEEKEEEERRTGSITSAYTIRLCQPQRTPKAFMRLRAHDDAAAAKNEFKSHNDSLTHCARDSSRLRFSGCGGYD